MKVCPTCQTDYADDSNVFCLNDGTPLVDRRQNLRQTPPQNAKRSSLPLVLAILAGFVVFAVIVGGIGLFLFAGGGERSAENSETRAANVGTPSGNQNKSTASVNVNQGLSSVQIETNRAGSVRPSASSAANAAPRIVGSASSVRRADKGNFYFPNFAFDKNPATAWCEGAVGVGVGEWLNFEFDREVRLRQIKIEPGYFKSSQSWRDNNRVAEALIEFSDGTSQVANFADQMTAQTIDTGSKLTRWVRVTIEDVYEGARDAEDTLISEVSFVTEP